MERTIRVLVADDHPVVRAGVRELLVEEADIAVVGEARDGREAVALALAERPDVVVMDVAMPVLSGLDATRRICASTPDVRVLVLTAHQGDPYLYELLGAGASGYLLKTGDGQAIVRAVRATAAGHAVIDPSVAPRLLARIAQRVAPGDTLTERELHVLHLTAQGNTNKQIGAALHISDRTVQNHLANIYGKLGVVTRTEAVSVALQRDLIRLEQVA
jgi:DNA-binding NarL/FixJ family response regulator